MVSKERAKAITAPLAGQSACLHERPHALLEEQGHTLRPLYQQALERIERLVLPEQRAEQLVRALGRQRIEPELAVVGLAPPAVAVLRAIVDQEKEPRRRQALDQRVEEPLGLGIHPVEILEDQAERLDLTLAEEHPPQAVDRPPPALPGVESVPRGIVGRYVQK